MVAAASAAAAFGAPVAAQEVSPAPPPTEAPAVEAVPYRPIPPGSAAYAMQLPPLQADGLRTTLNSNLDANSTVWHFRSAWNVAALNCLEDDKAPILQGYAAFLRKYSRGLAAANSALDQRFVHEQGSRNKGIKAREAYMTQVYNYFALPPAQTEFCNVALAVANEFLAAPPATAGELAAVNLPRFEAVFQEFFRQYQEYQIASAAWDERWGELFGNTQPGYVAVHGYGGAGLDAGVVDLNAPAATDGPADAERVSLVATPETPLSAPITQPALQSGGQ
jgi:hypothetical protein